MTLNEIYDDWDVTDDECTIQACARIRDEYGETCLIAALASAPIEVALDKGLRAMHCWHEIEYLDRPSPRFGRQHAILLHNPASPGVSPDVVFENLAAMKAEYFMGTPDPSIRVVSKIITMNEGKTIMGMFWPPIADGSNSFPVMNS